MTSGWLGRTLIALLVPLVLSEPGAAQVQPPPLTQLEMRAEAGPRWFVSDHRGVFNGRRVAYRVEVFETTVRDGQGHPLADIVSYAYVAPDLQKPDRPVIFAFNGGPGHASVFLHLDALGPRILTPVLDGGVPSPPIVDNPQSPLDVADLVFLDPPGTGFSRELPAALPHRLHSIDSDAEAMSQVVVAWLRRHGRVDAPVYLYGESYGSVRAVAMGRELFRGSPQVAVAGLMLGGNSLSYRQGGQMPDYVVTATSLATMASLAWYHGKIDNKAQSWAEAVENARRFGRTEYISALMQGNRLDTRERDRIIRRLPTLIGISESYFRERGTLIVADFKRQLLRDSDRQLDGDDGRITFPASAPDAWSRHPELFSEHMETYVSRELRAAGLGRYTAETLALNPIWNYRISGARAPDATLSELMKANAGMRVMLVQGRYDTLTTLGRSEYIMDQAELARDRYRVAYYDGGHFLLPQPEIMSSIRSFVWRKDTAKMP